SEDMGEDSAAPTNSHSTPIHSQPSSSKPQKKQSRRKQRKDSGPTKLLTGEATNEEHVLDLEEAKTAQAKEIASLKKRVKQLEKRKKSRTLGFKSLRKGRKIADIDQDAEATLVDETQRRNDEEMLFDVNNDLQGKEVVVEKESVEKEVSEKEVSIADPVTTANEVVTTTSAEIPDELTLAQTLIEIKTTKPKVITTAATTVTLVRPRAKGIIFHDQEEQAPLVFSSQSQLLQAKDKGKAKMVEPEKPLKKIDQIALDEEVTRRLEAQLQAELEEEEERLLAERLQTKEQEELTNEEKARLKEGSKKAKLDTAQESSSKRAGDELVQEKAKKEDLETLWKLVKAEHENTRPEEAYERVLWGDLKVMFEPDRKSEVWRNLQGYKVTI
ncbi:hypothetical protein Tco_1399102, partial [Tanacetum coccineum]